MLVAERIMSDTLNTRSSTRYAPASALATEYTGTNGSVSVSTPPTIRHLLEPVQGGLRLVEQKMKSVESSVFAPLADAFVELIGSGGKRLRPALTLLAAQVETPITDWNAHPKLIALAAAVEMLHTATLVHDDVIDGSLLRRGAPTLNASWSQGATVLAGDHMFARAAHFSAETGNSRVIDIFSSTLQIIVDGEMRQLYARNQYDQEWENYYQRIYAKTASLFSASTEAASVLMGLSPARTQQMKEYGYNFGMAFQLMDDILDFIGDDRTLGKPAGSDLRQGTLTLPFLYYLRQQSDPHALVERLLGARQSAEDGQPEALNNTVREVVAAIGKSDAIEAARSEAVAFLHRAIANLSTFPDSRSKESLVGLCDFVVQRSN